MEHTYDSSSEEAAMQTAIHTPDGWPADVLPPDTPGWRATAIRHLLDCGGRGLRGHPALHHDPVRLAGIAADHVERCYLAATAARPPGTGATATTLAELRRRRRAIALLEEALRGHVFLRAG